MLALHLDKTQICFDTLATMCAYTSSEQTKNISVHKNEGVKNTPFTKVAEKNKADDKEQPPAFHFSFNNSKAACDK